MFQEEERNNWEINMLVYDLSPTGTIYGLIKDDVKIVEGKE